MKTESAAKITIKLFKRKSFSLERKIKLVGTVFLLPWIFGMINFFIIPIARAFWWSFCDVRIVVNGVETTFKGWENFDYILFKDPNYIRNIVSNLQDLALSIIIIIVFSMFVAVLLNQKFRGRSLVRSLFFLPVIVSSGIIIKVLKEDAFLSVVSKSKETHIFQTDAVQSVLYSLGIQGGIVDSFTGFASQIFDLTWQSGLQIILFLAALQAIPDSYMEVCDIEGASKWERFWTVTFPVVAPTTFIVFVYTVIASFTDVRNVVMSNILGLFNNMHLGTAVASAVFYFLLIVLLLGIIYQLTKKKVFID